MRLYSTLMQVDIHPASRHFRGLPSVLGGDSEPDQLAWPRVLTIIERPDGVFLDRFDEHGESVGDTWHMSIADAKVQAATEYPGMVGEWVNVSDEVHDGDIASFALRKTL